MTEVEVYLNFIGTLLYMSQVKADSLEYENMMLESEWLSYYPTLPCGLVIKAFVQTGIHFHFILESQLPPAIYFDR